MVICCSLADDLISNSVQSTSSSVYAKRLDTGNVTLVPQWAVQADSSSVWTSCFVSEKERNPWWGLRLKSVTLIVNVRILLLPYNSVINVPPDTDFETGHLDNLTVYITNNTNTGSFNGPDSVRCGDQWSFSGSPSGAAVSILFKCSVYGQFLYATVDAATGERAIGLCSVVVNEKSGKTVDCLYTFCFLFTIANCMTLFLGPDSPLDFSTATVAVSSEATDRGGHLAIDGDPVGLADRCSSTIAESSPWLRIDLSKPYYVREIRVFFYGSGGDGASVYGGRNLRRVNMPDGSQIVNQRCGIAAVAVSNGSFWHNATCDWPLFTQHIYVARNSSSDVTLEVCEVQVFYGK